MKMQGEGDGIVKTVEDVAKQEFEDELLAQFENTVKPDIETFKVKDKSDVLFGLRIESRHEGSFPMSLFQRSKVDSLFEFDIDEYITLTTLTDMLKLDTQ